MPSFRSAVFVAFVCVAVGCDDPSLRESGDFAHPKDETLRMNQIQALATHNSYHIRETPTDVVDWRYEHQPLPVQLEMLGIRGLDLDLHWNPEDVDHLEVFHVGFNADEGSTCRRFTDCLDQIRAFSDANPGHHPIVVQLELKEGIQTPELWAEIDDEIRSVFPRDLLITPDFVRGTHATVAEALAADGWPKLAAVRGRVLFGFDCNRDTCLGYVGEDGTLDGQVVFPDSLTTDPWAAFMVHNSPDAAATTLVQAGYLVRVFADGYVDVLAGMNDLDAALASGAQIVSTDVPAPIAETSYVADIPGGTPSRCNPVNAPPDCVSTDVEDPALLQGR